MKYTLLDIVQTVLASMDSDEVNSITDTTESLQIAYIARNVFGRMCASGDLPRHMTTFNLTATGASTPTLMTKPTTVTNVSWVKYDVHDLTNTYPQFREILPIQLSEFLRRMHSLNTNDSNVFSYNVVVDGSDTMKIMGLNNVAPRYYTSFDDNTIIFDAYDSSVESNLQSSKTLCFGEMPQQFLLTDSYVPPLNDDQFDLLVNECRSWAHAELKQMANPKAENAARRGWINLQRKKRTVPLDIALGYLPNYGRPGTHSSYNEYYSRSKNW